MIMYYNTITYYNTIIYYNVTAAFYSLNLVWPLFLGNLKRHQWEEPGAVTGAAAVAVGRWHWGQEHTWADDGLWLGAWLQARPADGPAGHVSPVNHPLPAVVVDPHHDGALPGSAQGHGVTSCRRLRDKPQPISQHWELMGNDTQIPFPHKTLLQGFSLDPPSWICSRGF